MRLLLIGMCALRCLAASARAEQGVEPASFYKVEQRQGRVVDSQELERIRHIIRSRGNNPAARALLLQLVRDLPVTTAGELFEEIAIEKFTAGEVDLAAQYRQTITQSYPQTPAGARAFVWLARFYASGELAHAKRQGEANTWQGTPLPEGLKLVEEKSAEAGRPANYEMLLYANYLATSATQQQQALKRHPALIWQRAVAMRLANETDKMQGMLTQLKHRAVGDLWRARTRAEAWLADPKDDDCPLPVATCAFTGEPPYLDGKHTEPFWQQSAILTLPKSTTSAEETQVRMAYDQEYLYLAVTATKRDDYQYANDHADGEVATEPARVRDEQLQERDRVRVRLDVDRDYATTYDLTIDHRGHTHDACWGDVSWNPEWFVATAEGRKVWRAEVAVSWASLVARAPQNGAAWSVVVERLGAGRLAAGRFAAANGERADGNFRVLLFE